MTPIKNAFPVLLRAKATEGTEPGSTRSTTPPAGVPPLPVNEEAIAAMGGLPVAMPVSNPSVMLVESPPIDGSIRRFSPPTEAENTGISAANIFAATTPVTVDDKFTVSLITSNLQEILTALAKTGPTQQLLASLTTDPEILKGTLNFDSEKVAGFLTAANRLLTDLVPSAAN